MSSILATRSLAAKSRPSAAMASDQLRPVHPVRPSKYNSDLDLLFSQEQEVVSRNVSRVEQPAPKTTISALLAKENFYPQSLQKSQPRPDFVDLSFPNAVRQKHTMVYMGALKPKEFVPILNRQPTSANLESPIRENPTSNNDNGLPLIKLVETSSLMDVDRVQSEERRPSNFQRSQIMIKMQKRLQSLQKQTRSIHAGVLKSTSQIP